MDHINVIFERIERFTKIDDSGFIPILLNNDETSSKDKSIIFISTKTFLNKIFKEIDDLACYIKKDDTVLISVKNQKLLRTCFQLIVSLGISPCLVPGLGISLSKRSTLAAMLSATDLSDEQKYELLTECTDFFVRSYSIPVLKNIIISFHLSDYLAALIQLSFAPLKKPGVYTNFTMTQEMYDKLNLDKKKYIKIYDHLVSNCFQPILMKELLVLQNVKDKTPPAFVRRTITKELSRRLIAQGGLLSLIRCFMDSLEMDSGIEWKKIDIICKLIATKHGDTCENEYVQNICNQLKQILILNNNKYLTTAIACLITLTEKYPESIAVIALTKDVFDSFKCENISKSYIPGTIIFTTQQIEHKIQTYHSALSLPNQEIIRKLLTPNLSILFLIGMKCTNEGIKNKLNEILTKCMEKMDKNEIPVLLKSFLFGDTTLSKVTVEEIQAGLILKAMNNIYPQDDALFYFIELFKQISDHNFIQAVLEISLQMLIDFSVKRNGIKIEPLLAPEDEPILLNDLDKQYLNVLHLLSVISESSKINECLKKAPQIVFNFIEYFLEENKKNSECETIALILLNTILPNIDDYRLTVKLRKIIPILEKISQDELNTNSILSKEAILLINGGRINKNSAYEKVASNAFDNLLPTRGHGILELTKLINQQDAETISKRDMSIVHKTILLNTMLTACRDHDPLIRASALSNLAEISLVLHYRIGSIIYEVLLCIGSIIETDKAGECRRAAVMVISSLLKGLGKETLIQLKEHLLPLYRMLNKLYKDPNEDHAVKLHAQTALEELNDIVYQFLLPNIDMKKEFSLLDETKEIIYK
ncbi:Transmembrane and coiled-coil domain-containing protein 7 [Papilio xuthus]|uniref:Transmembrane and coiled-coil domain-containing protein 7 n=1 Tax=Papilio xuthus TaxID=66420 RepID=A0A194PUB0_PAPXU|nr:Transmembrane and coiled-coil domain-containing protein 7 [Papilio xuthus]